MSDKLSDVHSGGNLSDISGLSGLESEHRHTLQRFVNV